jgi:hypothetical protein
MPGGAFLDRIILNLYGVNIQRLEKTKSEWVIFPESFAA